MCLPFFEGRDDNHGIYIYTYAMVNYMRGVFEESNLVGPQRFYVKHRLRLSTLILNLTKRT